MFFKTSKAYVLCLGLFASYCLKTHAQDANLESLFDSWGAGYQLFNESVGEISQQLPGQSSQTVQPKTYGVVVERSTDHKKLQLMIPSLLASDGDHFQIAVVHLVGSLSLAEAQHAANFLQKAIFPQAVSGPDGEQQYAVFVPTMVDEPNTQRFRASIEETSLLIEQLIELTKMAMNSPGTPLADALIQSPSSPTTSDTASEPMDEVERLFYGSDLPSTSEDQIAQEAQLEKVLNELLAADTGSSYSSSQPMASSNNVAQYSVPNYQPSTAPLASTYSAPTEYSTAPLASPYSAPTEYSTAPLAAPAMVPTQTANYAPQQMSAYSNTSPLYQPSQHASAAMDPATRRSLLEFERKKCLDQLQILRRMHFDHDVNFHEGLFNGIISGSAVAGSSSALRQQLEVQARLTQIDEELAQLQWNR